MALLHSLGDVYITTSIGHPWPVEQVIKIFWIHVPLDYLAAIKVIIRQIDEEINCVSVFQNHVALRMVQIWLRNRLAKLRVKSANKNTELHIFLFNIFSSWRLIIFTIIIEWNKTPLVKGRRIRELNISHMYDSAVTAELHVGRTRWAMVMRCACYNWCSKPLALVSREIIG